MLDESEVIARGVECFKDGLNRYDAFISKYSPLITNLLHEWLPSGYIVNGVKLTVMTGMHMHDQCHYSGVFIDKPEEFDLANQAHLDALQIGQWLYMQMETIGDQAMFFAGDEPDPIAIGSTSAHCAQFYDQVVALLHLPLYPHLPERFRQGMDAIMTSCERIYAERLKAEDEEAYRVMRASARHGFVYLIQSPTGSYKIGRTKDPEDRMKTFSVKLPFEVDYVHLIETSDMYELERTLHKKYATKRINGEWFMLEPEDVAFICQFRAVRA